MVRKCDGKSHIKIIQGRDIRNDKMQNTDKQIKTNTHMQHGYLAKWYLRKEAKYGNKARTECNIVSTW